MVMKVPISVISITYTYIICNNTNNKYICTYRKKKSYD